MTDIFRPAGEQWTSEFCFQPFDAPGESWLGNTTALRRTRKVQLLAEHEKVLDLLKLHGRRGLIWLFGNHT